jgi:hypothetical protein
MAVILKGFDPDLGKKFMEESQGRVIVRAKRSSKPSQSEPDDEYPPGATAQEQQDLANRKARREMGR